MYRERAAQPCLPYARTGVAIVSRFKESPQIIICPRRPERHLPGLRALRQLPAGDPDQPKPVRWLHERVEEPGCLSADRRRAVSRRPASRAPRDGAKVTVAHLEHDGAGGHALLAEAATDLIGEPGQFAAQLLAVGQ